MDIDYLLIILPSIVFLGIFGLILVIWQYGNFRGKKENKLSTVPTHSTDATLANNTYYSNLEFQENTFTQSFSANKKKEEKKSNSLIILQLFAAEERPYRGYELLQTLSSAGFHYGEMNIFHYYSNQNQSKKERLFSLASAIEPGTFDLTHIGEILSPGLCLFMSVNPSKNSLDTFELMLETAQILIQDLGGTLCDEQRQALTPDSLAQYRSQVHAYA